MTKHLPFDRASRVAEQIFHIVAELCRTKISDPRLSGVEITRVKMTRDLRIARVYYHFLNDDQARREQAERGFHQAAGFLKRAIGQEIKIKFMPTMEFFYDERLDEERHIEELFENLKTE